MTSAKAENVTTSELLKIKNNPLFFSKSEYIQTFDIFDNIEDDPKEFHEYYQHLASTREEQEQHLEQLNTQLCQHCLIFCDFQYCNECDFIYNLLPYIIYMISEEEPISSCTSELESVFNSDSNSNNVDNENISSSSTQYSNKNINDSDSNLNPRIYITLLDLSKEQELKWYSDNNEGIMPEHAHNTNAGAMDKIDIPVNIAEKEIVDKEEIISTHQLIFIPLYDQYMLAIKREVKNQAQLFEAEAIICKSGEIGFTNLYILAKSPKNIKILIYNTTGKVIEIPKGTIIRYLTIEVEDQPPNYIPDFPQLCEYVDITL
ncbi:hypothetical protein G9A89_003159 [Geosiphon pyriformis]|nr:hypothetical protein G9A89_003159 [Geosiphon pyriformis]